MCVFLSKKRGITRHTFAPAYGGPIMRWLMQHTCKRASPIEIAYAEMWLSWVIWTHIEKDLFSDDVILIPVGDHIYSKRALLQSATWIVCLWVVRTMYLPPWPKFLVVCVITTYLLTSGKPSTKERSNSEHDVLSMRLNLQHTLLDPLSNLLVPSFYTVVLVFNVRPCVILKCGQKKFLDINS